MRVGGGLRSHLTSVHFNLLTKEEINLLYWEIKICLKPRGVHRSGLLKRSNCCRSGLSFLFEAELPGPAWCVGSWAADCVWNISFQTFRYAAPAVLWNPLKPLVSTGIWNGGSLRNLVTRCRTPVDCQLGFFLNGEWRDQY